MSVDRLIRPGHTILFGLLIFLAIIEGSLSAWLISRYNSVPSRAFGHLHARTGYMVFVSAWTVIGSFILLLFVLISSAGNLVTSVAGHGIFLGLTWLFWTAGAIAITQSLGGGINCSTVHRLVVYCNQLNAVLGFAWACWIIVTVLFLVVIVRGISSSRRGDGAKGQLV